MLTRLLRRLIGDEIEIALASGIFRGTIVSVANGFIRFVETAMPTYGNAELMFIPVCQVQFIRIVQD